MNLTDGRIRCSWVSEDKIYKTYHDTVWGRPELNSKKLFAKLCLDGQQAGLSWITILKKQQNYERAFYDFEPEKIAMMTEDDIERLMQDSGIIRNRLKINSIITNARAYLDIASKMEFSDYIWQFTDHVTITNAWRESQDAPVSTDASKAMSKALKKDGFKFVGETICYAFMQAAGLVNDHVTSCHCYEPVRALARK